MNSTPDFTIVSTVFNEGARLQETIGDFEKQTLLPNEIIITDAGSDDGTYEDLLKWQETSPLNIKILQENGCNVARGRNLAIAHSSYDLVVSTDFGCRFSPEWLKSLVTPFSDPQVKAVGGAYSVKEDEINTAAARANYLLTGGYTLHMDQHFIPSSRSIAYYKSVWEMAGKYPEWLTLAADDLVFGKVVKAKGINFFNVEEKNVFWGRHEKSKGYAKEAFRYGLGDGEARVNFRNFISNALETLLRYFLFTGVLLFLVNATFGLFNPGWFLLFIPGVAGLRSYKNAFKNWRKVRSTKYHFGIFLFSLWLTELTRINYLKGYIKGYFFSPEKVKNEAEALERILNTIE